MRSPLLLGIILTLFAATAIVKADDAKKPPAPTTISADQDPLKLPPADLDVMIKHLSKDELAVEVAAWQELLKAKVKEIGIFELASRKATGEEKVRAADEIVKKREERTQLVDRLNVILAEFKKKGGDPKETETYIDAISEAPKVDVTDAHKTYTVILGWLKSPEGGIRYLKNILLFLGTLVVFKVLSSIAGGITNRGMIAFKHVSNLLRDFAVNTVRKVVMFVGFVVALSMLEVNIGPFLAAMGAAGFVIGFALQGTLSNFASGVMILLYRPYDLGDTITVAGTTGKVSSMTLVSTVLHNADNHAVMIPNSSIWGGTITNLSSGQTTVASKG